MPDEWNVPRFPITSLHVHLANERGTVDEKSRIISFIELKGKLEKESERGVRWFLAYFPVFVHEKLFR